MTHRVSEGNPLDLEAGRHILTKVVQFSSASLGKVPPCPMGSVYRLGEWTHAFVQTGREAVLEGAGRC